MISFHEYGWRSWNLHDILPHMADEEGEEIYRHVPRDNLTILINLYQNPAQILPNSGSGRNTPTKFYMSFLGEAFDHQVRNGNNTLELTRDHNDSRVNLVPRTVQTTALSVPQNGQNVNRTTEPFFQVHPSLASILRTAGTMPPASAQVRFDPNLLNNPISVNNRSPPRELEFNVTPEMGSTPFRRPQTNNTPTTNSVLGSAPIMSSSVYTNPVNPRNSIPDPLMGLTQDETIIRNIVNEYDDRSQVLTSIPEAVPSQNTQVRNPLPHVTPCGKCRKLHKFSCF